MLAISSQSPCCFVGENLPIAYQAEIGFPRWGFYQALWNPILRRLRCRTWFGTSQQFRPLFLTFVTNQNRHLAARSRCGTAT